MNHNTRRSLLIGAAGAAGASLLPGARPQAQTKPKVAALFAGLIDDGGFMESGYRGLVSARERLGVEFVWRDKVRPEQALLSEALRELAKSGAGLVVAHGGQNNEAAKLVAADFPDIRFVVTQGNVTGANLASYEVLQEESAFLAGALAGWTTLSGVVGHMSGIRVVPGLKGRAAFAHGLAHANPNAKLLTNFSGNQDDNALSRKIAGAMIDQKVDVIFTMLNAGRTGAIEACRERGAKQIGNVRDWVAAIPDVFIGSAVADSGIAVLRAVEDFASGTLATNRIEKIGLSRPEAIRLTISPTIPTGTRSRIDGLAEQIKSGTLVVPTSWTGPEFPNPD